MTLKKILVTGLLVVLSVSILPAQGDIDVLLAATQEDIDVGLQDANLLIEGYVSPLLKGVGLGLCNGWYNTAMPHKTLGFDLGFVAGIAFIPDEDLFYNVQGLQLVESRDGDAEVPTIFGPTNAPFYQLKSNSASYFEAKGGLDMKKEVGFNGVPYAIPQLGIGIVKGTDIKIRYLPTITLGEDEGSIKVIGFGVMHDITQHIAGLKNIPFNLSGLVGFTKVDMNYDYIDPVTETLGEGTFRMKSTTIQAIISKEIAIATFYGSLGYNIVKSGLQMKGDYIVDEFPGVLPPQTVSDPVDLDLSTTSPRFTLGMRLKLAILTLNADYTFQKYKTLNVGIGFSVR